MAKRWNSPALLAVSVAAAALCVLGASANLSAAETPDEPTSGVKPSAIHFPVKYGALTFPEKFPAGTTLSITQWSHFVPRYDKWFDAYAQQWGAAHNVNVSVQHISYADLNSTLAAAIAANKGPALMQMNATPAAFIQGLQPLDDVNDAAKAAYGAGVAPCTHQAYLPVKQQWYAYCVGWVVDPGDYRISLWKDAGYPQGPATYDDLFKGGQKIYQKTGIPVGVGMSPEIDSEFYARSLIWSFGGTVQDACGNVTLDSPQVLDAVKYQAKLFHAAETPEVFSWNAASNNQAFVSGRASYIQNSISFYRTAQESNPKNATDTGFRPGLKGPNGDVRQTAHVWFIYVLPKYVTDKNQILAAKKFMLDLAANYSSDTYYSKLYDFPAYPPTVPQLEQKGGWIDHDPWGSDPPDKLSVLRGALAWTAWLGYPGYANPATSEVYNTFLLSTMMAQAARGEKTPEQAVKDTAAQMQKIVEKWKRLGYVGCGREASKD
ncbi:MULTISPECIES: extracellular solute-binding protein [unclassified Bradyrhizobium]|uniref:ABC transporter substrate-binding protein n=1 Tax=unclassified Bradyrhizobium TaxID=2631580 RepID=UPI00247ADAA8|nr:MULTISPECIES: extracellular solute-binding protein [unclassified Bradyrhizobium]WGR70228.1 extracellular solute-binding protein [Bradyrhizobium sp. ISRA426]WGR82286.1 extracellular solute-binding protein [Bradyrhizobium sp. ISRA430]WGR85472.1 extracellular solute-binding protein [Bradyrhizobium sp. ISRA432]